MKYISILRGINVSGQKKIRMADLKRLYESLGFKEVVSYIQSGNVLFHSKEEGIPGMISLIEKAIEDSYAFHVPVQVLTGEYLHSIIKDCPFEPVDPIEDGKKVSVTFLASEPDEEKIQEVLSYLKPPDKLIIRGKAVYFYCPGGYGKTKLSNNFLERKLKVVATTRNWKTVLKLAELSKE